MAQRGSATTASESEMKVSQNLRQLKKFWAWVWDLGLEVRVYRGSPLIRNSEPLGPYSRTMPRALWCP